MKKKLGLFLFGVLALSMVFAPVAFAQTVGEQCDAVTDIGTLMRILCKVAFLINALIPVLISIAVLYFIWGIVQYVMGKSDDAKSEGRQRMIWGIIGLIVITGMWGIVGILLNSFDIGGSTTIDVPCIESVGVTCPQNQ